MSGVVLVQCRGCKKLHLIADNLGWFSDAPVNAEDFVKLRGEAAARMDSGVLQQLLNDLHEPTKSTRVDEQVDDEQAEQAGR
jgi:DNL zinc finger